MKIKHKQLGRACACLVSVKSNSRMWTVLWKISLGHRFVEDLNLMTMENIKEIEREEENGG